MRRVGLLWVQPVRRCRRGSRRGAAALRAGGARAAPPAVAGIAALRRAAPTWADPRARPIIVALPTALVRPSRV